MTDLNKGIADLETLFADIRQEDVQMPSGLMDRIVADADQTQAGFARPPNRAKAPGLWAQLIQSLGGWPAMGGLAAACAAGVWIGLAPPSFMPDPAGYVFETETDLDLIGGDQLAMALAEDG